MCTLIWGFLFSVYVRAYVLVVHAEGNRLIGTSGIAGTGTLKVKEQLPPRTLDIYFFKSTLLIFYTIQHVLINLILCQASWVLPGLLHFPVLLPF